MGTTTEKEYKVTAFCLAFNHEKYIRKTLEGFVSQKTDFGFKVIVHDDASTDGTADIIREYAQKYPDIIIPVYQSENQYSKGVKILDRFIFPLVDTEYVMSCEGDDYWCDENKMQMQYDFLSTHPEYSLCVHNTKWIDQDGNSLDKTANPSQEDGELTAHQIIAAGGGGLCHCSSFLYRIADRKNMPREYLLKGMGDYPLIMHLSHIGKVYYMGRIMSAYRVGVSGGWTATMMRNKKNHERHINEMIQYLQRVDNFTQGRYHQSYVQAIAKYRVDAVNLGVGVWRALFDTEVRAHLKEKYPAFGKRAAFICKSMAKGILLRLGIYK